VPYDISRYLARRARFTALAAAELRRPQRVGDVLPDAHRRADWRRVHARHQQWLRIYDADPHQEALADLREALADALRAVYNSYRRFEEDMCRHVLAVFVNSDEKEILNAEAVLTHYADARFAVEAGGTTDGRRLPAPMEATVETCRRLRDAHTLRRACADLPLSYAIAGSTNYGAFYSVRGRRDDEPASDLDCLMVVPDASAIGPIVARLAGLPGIDRAGLDLLSQRTRIFAGRHDDGQTTLVHKLSLWTGDDVDPIMAPLGWRHDYQLSLHFVTAAVLAYLLLDSAPRIDRDEAGGRRTVRIYRDTPPVRLDQQRSFDGCAHRMDVDVEQAELGYLRTSLAYKIDPLGRYVPGFYQAMMMPLPDVLCDDLDIAPQLTQLHLKLNERLARERQRGDGFTLLRQSFAHPRRAIFAPGVIRQLDASYLGS
jgi:hypothetical protein